MNKFETRARRGTMVLAITVVMLLGGCGVNVRGDHGAASGTSVDARSGASRLDAANLAPAALDVRAASATLHAERFVRVKTTTTMTSADHGTTTFEATTTADTASGNLEIEGSLPAISVPSPGIDLSSFTVRKVGSVFYAKFGASTKWVKFDAGSMGAKVIPVPTNTQSLLDGLGSIGIRLTKDGTVTRSGETLDRYVGTFNVNDLLAKLDEHADLTNRLPSTMNAVTANATVLITPDGHTRHIEVTATDPGAPTASLSMTADYENVTGSPDLSAPPASQITDPATAFAGVLSGDH